MNTDDIITYDEENNIITDYDLNAGLIETIYRVKEDALPLDGIERTMYTDEDFETIQVYHPFTEEEINRRENNENIVTANAIAELSELISDLYAQIEELSK